MVTTYLSEFHSAKYKARFAMWSGLAVNTGIIVPAGKLTISFRDDFRETLVDSRSKHVRLQLWRS